MPLQASLCIMSWHLPAQADPGWRARSGLQVSFHAYKFLAACRPLARLDLWTLSSNWNAVSAPHKVSSGTQLCGHHLPKVLSHWGRRLPGGPCLLVLLGASHSAVHSQDNASPLTFSLIRGGPPPPILSTLSHPQLCPPLTFSILWTPPLHLSLAGWSPLWMRRRSLRLECMDLAAGWQVDLVSVHFSRSVVSNSLKPRGLQNSGPPCPSPNPGACSDSCPLSQ